jgi:hypothetical protein
LRCLSETRNPWLTSTDWNKTCVQGIWRALEAGNTALVKKTLKKITAGFVAFADVPFYTFTPELAEMYPEAKIVLVQRGPEDWWPSFQRAGRPWYSWYTPLLSVLAWPAPGLRWLPLHFRLWQAHYTRVCAQEGTEMGPGKELAEQVLCGKEDMNVPFQGSFADWLRTRDDPHSRPIDHQQHTKGQTVGDTNRRSRVGASLRVPPEAGSYGTIPAREQYRYCEQGSQRDPHRVHFAMDRIAGHRCRCALVVILGVSGLPLKVGLQVLVL